jgi:5,10-methylenetetrahydromethanopterin reductase
MEISCAFATSLSTPDHIVLAEQLGYRRAWCYDSPALYPDVWITLALAAERTTRISLGPGVLIPSLRHVLTNAAAIAHLEHLAPGRVVVAVGSGFTGRRALGQRPLRWSFVRSYIVALRRLLQGEEVEWEGAAIKMLHPDGFAPPRPIAVPILVGTAGPKGIAVAREVGDGYFGQADPGAAWVARLHHGTVLDDGEDPGAERVMLAAGHAAAVAYHAAYERGTGGALPRWQAFADQVEALPARSRHLALHTGHLIAPNDIDRSVLTGDLLVTMGLAGTVEAQRSRLDQLAQRGVTEAVYQPAGPDIPRELRRFADVAGL